MIYRRKLVIIPYQKITGKVLILNACFKMLNSEVYIKISISMDFRINILNNIINF